MTEAKPSDRRTTGSAALGVAIAVGTVLLLAMGWLALEDARLNRAWMAISADGPKFVARWLADIRAGRLDEAFGSTGPAYRARVDRAAFGRWVADHPELASEPTPTGTFAPVPVMSVTIGWNGVRFRSPPPRLTDRSILLRPGVGKRRLTTVVVSDPGGLRIDQAEFEPVEDLTPRP